MYFYVEKKFSEKSGKEYFVLGVDLGFKTQALCFNSSVIASALDVKESDLYNKLERDVKFAVAYGKDNIDFTIKE